MVKDTLDRWLERSREPEAWQVYHEASKTSPLEPPVPAEAVHRRMLAMWPSFPYEGYPAVALPPSGRIATALSDAVTRRETARDICAVPLSLEQTATLLFHMCGETRDETAAGFPRKFRVVPSGGATYPLEVYLHSTRIAGLEPGIHHYNPCDHVLRRVIAEDGTSALAEALVQKELAVDTAALLFITSVTERSAFKYGETGYRFALLEAGHMAQNLVLAATALGLGAVTIGGFFDRSVDRILGLDGLSQSTVYMVALGGRSGTAWIS